MSERIEVLTIGDELLDGSVIDGNGAHIGAALAAHGRAVERAERLPDRLDVLVPALKAIAARADVCICTGGLGPTDDDLTLEALARAAGVERAFDAAAWARIEQIYGARTPPARNRRQATLPAGARPLYSEVGTAPGVELRIDGCRVFALPGVPREMRWFMQQHVLPALAAGTRRTRLLRCVGRGESTLQEVLDDVPLPAGVEVAWLTPLPEVHIKLSGDDPAALDAAAAAVRGALGDVFVGEGEMGLAAATIHACAAAGWHIGAAESCTGGLVGAALTDVSGSSAVFDGSIVSYANTVKHGVLGVPLWILDSPKYGAVSEECARAMALGAREVLGVDVAVAITGIAGPGGGSDAKPVGTVWFAWAGLPAEAGAIAEPTVAERRRFRGDRERVRIQAMAWAIDRIRRAALAAGVTVNDGAVTDRAPGEEGR